MSNQPRQPLSNLVVEGVKPVTSLAGTLVWHLNLNQIESNTGRILHKHRVNVDLIGSSTHSFAADTVLYSKLRPYLNKVVVADEAGIATTELVPLRCDPQKLLPNFLAYFLRSPEFLSFANTVVAGAKMPRMVMSEFWKYAIPVPALAEQRRIAAILDQAHALCFKRRETLAQLDSLAQSIFIDMFGDPVANPMRWPVSTISELPIHIADGNYSSKYPAASEFVEVGIPFVRANNLINLTIDSDDLRFITPEKHIDLAKGHLREGDVLISTRGEIGKVGIVPPEFDDANINAQLVLLRTKGDVIATDFLCHLLNTPSMNLYVRSFETGVALKQLPIHALKRIQVPVPPIELQESFAKLMLAVGQQREMLTDANAQSEVLFSSLQYRAFRGEL